MFARLLLVQWALAVVLAFLVSPRSWNDTPSSVHSHVLATLTIGGLINAVPLLLIRLRPSWWGTRHSIAVAQMLWGALLITITGGRIETHFHVFVSLTFLAFYRDWKVISTATAVVAIDHLICGLWWPEGIYGLANPEWWRFLEHVGWVLVEDAILIFSCLRGLAEMRAAAVREIRTEAILERKVEERTLEVQDGLERFRSLVENTEAIQFEYDIVAREMLYLAPQAADLLECSPHDLVDIGFLTNVVHPEDRTFVLEAVRGCADGSRASSEPLDCRLITKSGRAIMTRTFLRREGSRRVRGTTLDVTRQRQLEIDTQQAQKLESVGRLAAGVAHEINTPIQYIGDSVEFARFAISDILSIMEKQRLAMETMLRGEPAVILAREAIEAGEELDLQHAIDQLPGALDRAADGAARVGKIVRSMKVFSEPDHSKAVPVDLNQAIESALALASNEYRFVADIATDYGELPRVPCHAGEISQAILNVVINATHAIKDVVGSSGRRGCITVMTRHHDDHAVISISDTGGGIADEIRGRIYDPFFTTKEVGRGTGQGLAVARSITEKHRGSISFDTVMCQGTTFHIRLPIPVVAAKTAA